MKTNKKYLLLGIFALVIILIIGGYLYLNPSHRNIADEEVGFMVTTSELEESFRRAGPETKMADQVIKTTGEITELDEKSVTLDGKVEVSFTNKLSAEVELGMEVTIKGRCVGYDDLLQMVKIDQATLMERF
jgi:hypothetical protein